MFRYEYQKRQQNRVFTGLSTIDCGQFPRKIYWAKIIGGQDAEVNEFPWIAMLYYNGNANCAGSLINTRYILTAAHCFDKRFESDSMPRSLSLDYRKCDFW